MKENSIEEDIKNAEHFIKSIKTDKEYKEDGWHGYYNKEIVELARILQHILSAYKRVLKENEELREDRDKLEKEYSKMLTKIDEHEVNYIPVSLVEEKIEEYFEDEEWLVEHDLRALCDDEKECREYYTNKKIALKDIKKSILDKLNKLLKNY